MFMPFLGCSSIDLTNCAKCFSWYVECLYSFFGESNSVAILLYFDIIFFKLATIVFTGKVMWQVDHKTRIASSWTFGEFLLKEL